MATFENAADFIPVVFFFFFLYEPSACWFLIENRKEHDTV